MDFKLMVTVFATIFVAEIADKTQLAALAFASTSHDSKFSVFIGSALALVVATALVVFFGGFLSTFVNEKVMARLAGTAFVLIGIWILIKY